MTEEKTREGSDTMLFIDENRVYLLVVPECTVKNILEMKKFPGSGKYDTWQWVVKFNCVLNLQ